MKNPNIPIKKRKKTINYKEILNLSLKNIPFQITKDPNEKTKKKPIKDKTESLKIKYITNLVQNIVSCIQSQKPSLETPENVVTKREERVKLQERWHRAVMYEGSKRQKEIVERARERERERESCWEFGTGRGRLTRARGV